MKTRVTFLFGILFCLAVSGFALAAAQTTCPVMGGEVNKNLYVDVEGKRIYVCCPYCIGEIKKDPQKYLQKMKEAGQEPEDAPKP